MIEELKINIAHLLIRMRFFTPWRSVIRFDNAVKFANKVLIILPSNQTDFENSLQVVRYFQIHKKEITLFIQDTIDWYIPQKELYTYFTFTEKSKTFFYLPNTTLKRRTKEKQYDIVIDLNRHENVFSNAVTCLLNSNIKIGFARRKPLNYYNILINDKEQNSEAAYRVLIKYLNSL